MVKNMIKLMIYLLTIAMPLTTNCMDRTVNRTTHAAKRLVKGAQSQLPSYLTQQFNYQPNPTIMPEQKTPRLQIAPPPSKKNTPPPRISSEFMQKNPIIGSPLEDEFSPTPQAISPQIIEGQPPVVPFLDDELSSLLKTPPATLPDRKIIPEIVQAAEQFADLFNAIPSSMDADNESSYTIPLIQYQNTLKDLIDNNNLTLIFVPSIVNLNSQIFTPVYPLNTNYCSFAKLNNGSTIIFLTAAKKSQPPLLIKPVWNSQQPEPNYRNTFFHIPESLTVGFAYENSPNLATALENRALTAKQQKQFQLASITRALDVLKNKIPSFQNLIQEGKHLEYEQDKLNKYELYIAELQADIRFSLEEISNIQTDFEQLKKEIEKLKTEQISRKKAEDEEKARLALQAQEAEKIRAATQEALRKARAEKAEQEKIAQEQAKQEQLAREKAEREKQIEQEKLAIELAKQQREQAEIVEKIFAEPIEKIITEKNATVEQKEEESKTPEETAIVPKLTQQGSPIAQAAENLAYTFNAMYDNISAANYNALLEQYQNTLANLVQNNNVLVTLIPPHATILPEELTPSALKPLISNDHFATTRLHNNFTLAVINAPQPSPLILVSSPEKTSSEELTLNLPSTIDLQKFDQAGALQFITQQLKPSLAEKPFEYSPLSQELVVPSQAVQRSSQPLQNLTEIALATKKLADAFNQTQTSTMSSAAFFFQKYQDMLTNLVENNNVIVGFIAPEVTQSPIERNTLLLPLSLIAPSETSIVNFDRNVATTKLVNGFTLALINAPQPSPVFILTPTMEKQDYRAMLNIPAEIEVLSVKNTPEVRSQILDKMLLRSRTIEPFQLNAPTNQTKAPIVPTITEPLISKKPTPGKLQISYNTKSTNSSEFGIPIPPQEQESPFELFKQLPQPPVPYFPETKKSEPSKKQKPSQLKISYDKKTTEQADFAMPIPAQELENPFELFKPLPQPQVPLAQQAKSTQQIIAPVTAQKPEKDLTIAQAAQKIAQAFNLIPTEITIGQEEMYTPLLESYQETLVQIILNNPFKVIIIDANVDLSSASLESLNLTGSANTNYSSRIKLDNNATLVLLYANKVKQVPFIITPPEQMGLARAFKTQAATDYKKLFQIPEVFKKINIVPVNDTSLNAAISGFVETAKNVAPAPIIPKIVQDARKLAHAFNAIPTVMNIDNSDSYDKPLKEYQEALTQLLKNNDVRIIFVAPEVDLKSKTLASLTFQDENQADYSSTIKLDNGATMIVLRSEKAERQPYIITPATGFLTAAQPKRDYREFFHIPETINAHITPLNDTSIVNDLTKMAETAENPEKAVAIQKEINQAKARAQATAKQVTPTQPTATPAAQTQPESGSTSWWDMLSMLLPKQQPQAYNVPEMPQPPTFNFTQQKEIPSLEFPEELQPPSLEFPEDMQPPSLEFPDSLDASEPAESFDLPEEEVTETERMHREPKEQPIKEKTITTQPTAREEIAMPQPPTPVAYNTGGSEPIAASAPQWHTAPAEAPKQPFRPNIQTGTYSPSSPQIEQPASSWYSGSSTSNYSEQPTTSENFFMPTVPKPAPVQENWASGILKKMRKETPERVVFENLPQQEPILDLEMPEFTEQTEQTEQEKPEQEKNLSPRLTQLAQGLMKKTKTQQIAKESKSTKQASKKDTEQKEIATPAWEKIKTAVTDVINYFKNWFGF